MERRNKIISWCLLVALTILLLLPNLGSDKVFSASQIRLIIDGKDITSSALLIIKVLGL